MPASQPPIRVLNVPVIPRERKLADAAVCNAPLKQELPSPDGRRPDQAGPEAEAHPSAPGPNVRQGS